MQARLDNMQSSLFAMISVQRTWKHAGQSGPQLMEEFRILGQQICICHTSSINLSCLHKMSFRIFLSICFPTTARVGSISVSWIGWWESFLYKVWGGLFQGEIHNSLHAKFSVNRKYRIQGTEVHLSAFCSLRFFSIKLVNGETPCVVVLSLFRCLSCLL